MLISTDDSTNGAIIGASEAPMAVGSAENGFARDAAFRSLTNTHGVEAAFLALLYDHAGESARTCTNEEPRA